MRLQCCDDQAPLLSGPRPITAPLDVADEGVEREWRQLIGLRLHLAIGRSEHLVANQNCPGSISLCEANQIALNAVFLQLTGFTGFPAGNPQVGELLVASGGLRNPTRASKSVVSRNIRVMCRGKRSPRNIGAMCKGVGSSRNLGVIYKGGLSSRNLGAMCKDGRSSRNLGAMRKDGCRWI